MNARSNDVAAVLEQRPGFGGFLPALLREIDVGPAGEPVFLIPGALAVTKQNELEHYRAPSWRIADLPA